MEGGSRRRTRLRALQRRVWGDGIYEEHARGRTPRQQRFAAVVVTAVGAQLVLTAVGLVLISTAASAHTSTINISCTEVEFVYRNFPRVTATAHESVVINGVETASRDITFQGPATTDTITIALGPGSHTVAASDRWAYNGSPQGSANAQQTLTYCHSSSTTTMAHESSTTSTSTPTSSTTKSSTTTSTSTTPTSTVPVSSTTSSTPSTATSTSTVPEASTSTSTSSTSVPETSTSGTVSTTTSTSGASSTTSVPETSTTIHELGSTTTTIGATTSSTIHQQGSTSTTTATRKLPVTGLSGLSIPAALGVLGVGVLAIGVTRLRRAIARS